MGATTPDAYRIGVGQVAQDYPADAVPTRLRKQPSLPTMARVPESVSSDEQVVTAEVAVVRRKASGASAQSRPSKDAVTVAQQKAVVRDGAPAQAGTSRRLLLLPASMRIETRLWWPSRVISAPAFLSIVTGIEPPCALWVRPRSEMVGSTARLSRRHRRRSRQSRALLTLEVRRGARLRPSVLPRLNRGWLVANAQCVVVAGTMASSCFYSGSSRRSCSSELLSQAST